MKKIVILGAGHSSSVLIQYLLDKSQEDDFEVVVCDLDLELAEKRVDSHARGKALQLNALNKEDRLPILEKADVVISMLPARYHVDIVGHCIELKKPLLTPSYLTDEIKAFHEDAVKSNVLVLNEMGLDPGIDHMSAMKMIKNLRDQGAYIRDFESFTGGLLAPESENNLWKYKFTWNPRNVVIAGQGDAVRFIQEGTYKYIPYHKLFRRTEIIEIGDLGKFDGYANRDSLKYRRIYELQDAQTVFRGTLRRKGFCKAWNVFVQLGLTDDDYTIPNSKGMSFREFINSFLAYNPFDSVELKLKHYLNIHQDDEELWEKLVSLDLFDDSKHIPLENATPAQCLQYILEQKWKLEPGDKDMIVMWHKLVYELENKQNEVHAHMVNIGNSHTAMAKTVGLPLGIAARHMLSGKYTITGTRLPIHAEIYEPVLQELEAFGIKFVEKTVENK